MKHPVLSWMERWTEKENVHVGGGRLHQKKLHSDTWEWLLMQDSINEGCGIAIFLGRLNWTQCMCFVIAETQRMGNSHLRKVSVSESNVLLDEEVLTDPKIQALLLTVLVRTITESCIFNNKVPICLLMLLPLWFLFVLLLPGHPGQIYHRRLWPADFVRVLGRSKCRLPKGFPSCVSSWNAGCSVLSHMVWGHNAKVPEDLCHLFEH